MKKCPATITDRERANQRGLNMFATFMRKTSMMILYYITIWASPGKPLFRICVQKHSSRTHRFPVLPIDVMALLDSADPKLKGRGVICSHLIRANMEEWHSSIDFWGPTTHIPPGGKT